MADKLTGDAPYYRTVPSSPSDDGQEEGEEERVAMSPIYQHQQQQPQQRAAAEGEEEDEETMLRRRLLEKKLEKEKGVAAATSSTTEKKPEREKSGKKTTTTRSTTASSSSAADAKDRASQKREKIVWSKGESRERTERGERGDRDRQHSSSSSGSRGTATASGKYQGSGGSSYTHVTSRDNKNGKPSSSSSSASHPDHRSKPRGGSEGDHGRHHHRDRDEKRKNESSAVSSSTAGGKRMEEGGGGGKKRPREGGVSVSSSSSSTSADGTIHRKRRNEKEEKGGKEEEEQIVVEEEKVVDEMMEVVVEEEQIEQGGGEVEEVQAEQMGVKIEAKRKKYSKFESSPEPSSEEEEDDQDDDGEEERDEMKKKDDEEMGQAGGGPLMKYALSADDEFGMDLGDDEHFRHRMDTADTDMNGTENGADLQDDLAENKDFELLTDEEKALLSPETLRRKEEQYQRRLVAKLPVYYPGISGCRGVAEYECLNKISEGTFGVVYRAQNKRTDEIVALKRLKMEKEHQGFPITSLREINMLLKCGTHPNVVNVREVVVGSSMDRIYLVMDYVEHDVKTLMELMKSRGKKWTIPQVKTLLRQLLSGVGHMHEEYVIHRDLKTSNLLLSHQGILKIGDFGLAREFGDPLKPYTPVVVTLWYRSPELLLGTKITDAGPVPDPDYELVYSTPVDLWSVGCIFAEFLKLEPLFPGRSELDQMQKIFKEVGTPNEQIWPGCMQLPGMKQGVFADIPYNQLRRKFASELPDDDGYELLNKLLALNPTKRLDAKQALASKWFVNEPKPADPSTFPTWPAKSEQNRRPPNEPMAPRGQQQQGGAAAKPAGGFTLKFDVPKFG